MKKIIYLLLLASLLFVGCDGNKSVPIDPQLIVSSETLIFNENEYKKLSISTSPISECEYRITSYPDWVEVSPLSGRIINSIEDIEIYSQLEGSLPGVYTGEIEIMTSFGNKTITLKGHVGEQILYTLAEHIDISVFETEKNIILSNDGNVSIDYKANVSNEYITLSENEGKVEVGEQQILSLKVNREKMETGIYEAQIFFNINDERYTMSVKIENFAENKIILKDDIIDAEYSKATNKLIYVSSKPLSLVIYDTETKSSERISLSYAPQCVSLSLNGEEAVVGHDGRITYVDLMKKAIIKTIDVPCNVFDIALGNKWAYAVPSNVQHTNLINIDLTNGKVQQSGRIYSDMNIRVHPSGKYIYLGNNGLSPGDISKMDIQNGAAIYLYNSPYHGDYSSGGKLWFSEDEMRVFSQYRSVFKCSDSQQTDLLYNGTISINNVLEAPYYPSIQWLEHASKKNELYIIYNEGYNMQTYTNIYVYNSENLMYKKKLELEKYMIKDNFGDGDFYDAEPYFVFSNSKGNSIYVITKAIGSGLLYEWALQEISIE